MEAIVKCATCNVVIATVEKPVFSDRDMQEYNEMSYCSEHVGIPSIEVVEEPEGE